MTAQLQVQLSRADRALARLDGVASTLPDVDSFVYGYIRQEAVLSSQIEGTQASLRDLLELEARVPEPGAPKDVEEVVNYVAAMNHGLRRVRELPVSRRLIREIHEQLLAGVRGGHLQAGEFRQAQNFIGAPGSSIEQALFVPPPPAEMEHALDQFERFLHDDSPMPDLIKVGLAHAQFETIHPFLDGNGRIGRLLMTLLLCEWQILEKPLLYLSHYLRQHRGEYYERLQAVRDSGDWESWLTFFLRGVELVATEAAAKAREIVRLREGLRLVIADQFGRRAPKALELVEKLYFQPFVTVNDVCDLINVSFAYANQLVAALHANDILVETSGRRRNRVFAFGMYLTLLEASPLTVTDSVRD